MLFTSPKRGNDGGKSASTLWGDESDDDDDDDGLFLAQMSKKIQQAEPAAVAQAVETMGAATSGNLFGGDDSDSDELFE